MNKEPASSWNSSGFSIQPFGKGRNAIQSKHANDLVDALNIVGRIRIQRGQKDSVIYADNGVFITIKDRQYETDAETFPFQIYQSGTWLKYKVKTGYYITTGNPITVTAIETEFTLTSGVLRYWFYIDASGATPEVKTSSTTLDWSSNKIPLGWVDTSTGSTANVSTPYQFVRDHIFNPCITT